MSYIAALFIPCLPLFLKGRIGVGLLLALAQLTIIGWIPATLISWAVVHETNVTRANKRAIKAAMRS